jgi:hypothetical protein
MAVQPVCAAFSGSGERAIRKATSKRPRQKDVGEDVGHVFADAAGGGDALQSCFEAAKAVALVDFAPLLPADDGVGVDEDDLADFGFGRQAEEGGEGGAEGFDGIGRVGGGAGGSGGDVGFHGFKDRFEQGFLGFEMMIQGSAADAGLLEDGFGGCSLVTG